MVVYNYEFNILVAATSCKLSIIRKVPCSVRTVCQMQPHHGHHKALRCQHLVLGEPEHQALQHLVAGRAPSFPQQRPQVVAAGLTGMSAVELVERDL